MLFNFIKRNNKPQTLIPRIDTIRIEEQPIKNYIVNGINFYYNSVFEEKKAQKNKTIFNFKKKNKPHKSNTVNTRTSVSSKIHFLTTQVDIAGNSQYDFANIDTKKQEITHPYTLYSGIQAELTLEEINASKIIIPRLPVYNSNLTQDTRRAFNEVIDFELLTKEEYKKNIAKTVQSSTRKIEGIIIKAFPLKTLLESVSAHDTIKSELEKKLDKELFACAYLI